MLEKAKLIIDYNDCDDQLINILINKIKECISKNNIDDLNELIEMYNIYVKQLWENQMTLPINYHEGKKFKFLVHNLTKDDFYDEFATEIVSASLITDKELCVCGRAKIGFILSPCNIVAAVPFDLFTKNDYFKPSFNLEDYNLRNYDELFNVENIILPPNRIEKMILEKSTNANGEMLNYEKSKIFSEIVIDGWYPTAIYTITNGEKELNSDYVRALNLNKYYMFDFIDIDKSVYRTKNGLEPLTINEQKELCLNILKLTNNSIELLENNYENIYKLFLEIKKSEYSSDRMLRESVKILKK